MSLKPAEGSEASKYGNDNLITIYGAFKQLENIKMTENIFSNFFFAQNINLPECENHFWGFRLEAKRLQEGSISSFF